MNKFTFFRTVHKRHPIGKLNKFKAIVVSGYIAVISTNFNFYSVSSDHNKQI